MAKCDEANESLIRSVSGDLETTANFADVVSGLPTSGLKQKTSGASEASGSYAPDVSSSRICSPSPAPPMDSRSTSGGSGTAQADPSETSIRR